MPRKNRFDYIHDDCIVHVRLQINNGDFRFNSNILHKLWSHWVAVYLKKYPNVKISGYQWMSNHCHLIIETLSARDLTKFLHDINWRFAFEYNKLTGRKGHFFQNRYQCTVISSDEQEAICQRYIYRNQVRAKMVQHPRLNRFGSYHHYAYGKRCLIITHFRNFSSFGKSTKRRRRMFRLFIETMNDQEELNVKLALKKLKW